MKKMIRSSLDSYIGDVDLDEQYGAPQPDEDYYGYAEGMAWDDVDSGRVKKDFDEFKQQAKLLKSDLEHWYTVYVTTYDDYAKQSGIQITASEDDYDEEDDWDFDPYAGGTYIVYYGDYGRSKSTNNPKTAISYWFQLQKKNPYNVRIMCKTREQAVKLCKAATEDYINQLNDKYGCPYKIDYIINGAAKAVSNGCKYFYENDYGYGDVVEPFSLG